MPKEKNKKSIVDKVKEIEKKKKAIILIKAIEALKKDAKKILEIKKKTNILLEELGLDEKEVKQLIDYINSMVQLTESDEKEIRDNVKKEIKDEEETLKKNIEDTPISSLYMDGSSRTIAALDYQTSDYNINTTDNKLQIKTDTCDPISDDLELKL